ncbi:universal stress protein [Slackia heliotrinireducens]|uniref:universal stress protein n=1 Tax=Slackia heliotrinireducens TaxID=84110 RepID=UPI00331468DA
MIYNHILVPYDGSDLSQKALFTALDYINMYDPKITVLNVEESDTSKYMFLQAAQASGFGQDPERTFEEGEVSEELIKDIEQTFGPIDGRFNVVQMTGKPDQVICEYVDSHNVDLIIMGCRGLGAVRAAFGSVSTAVLRGANCPIFVIK